MPSPAIIQENSEEITVSPGTATFTSAQTAGNLNVVGVILSSGNGVNTVTGVTDVAGNTYHYAGVVVGDTSGNEDGTIVLYYAWNIASAAAGANIVSAAFTAPLTYQNVIYIAEISGIQSSSDPLRVANVNSNPFPDGGTTGSVSLASTSASDWICMFECFDNTPTPAAGNLSVIDNDWSYTTFQAGQLGGGTVSVTQPDADNWWMLGAAFIASGGAPPGNSDVVPMVGGGRNPRNSTYLRLKDEERAKAFLQKQRRGRLPRLEL